MWWLLEGEALRSVHRAYSASMRPTAEQAALFASATGEPMAGPPRGSTVAGDVMEIRVEGVLTKTPDIFMWFFGIANTAYRDIISALAMAKSDASIKSVVLNVDSPGGQVDGLFDTLAAIEDVRQVKQVSVKAASAQSAAYAIAAVAGKIQATSAASSFGSIGVAVSYQLDDTIVTLTNTDSPDKRPDLTTEEGRAVIVEYLDAVNELFVDAIARGRGGDVTKDAVKAEYGRGATLLAGEAKKRGMIDSIAKPSLRAVAGNSSNASAEVGGAQPRKSSMTKEELRAQHPALYEAVFNEGVARGTADERERVDAHLTAGEMSGDVKTATDCIRAGTAMTMKLQTQYMLAAANRGAVNARQSDSDAAGAAADGAAPVTSTAQTKDLGDLVVAAMESERGAHV